MRLSQSSRWRKVLRLHLERFIKVLRQEIINRLGRVAVSCSELLDNSLLEQRLRLRSPKTPLPSTAVSKPRPRLRRSSVLMLRKRLLQLTKHRVDGLVE